MPISNEVTEEIRDLLSQIGLYLKAAREGEGITLQEISARTRINQSFLAMIEEGDVARLPSLAFVKGFIRNYMQVLELQEQSLEEAIQRLNALDGREVSQPLPQPRTNILDTELPSSPVFKWGLGGAVVILIVVAGFFLISGSGDKTPTQEPANQSQQTPPPSAPPDPGTVPAAAPTQEGNQGKPADPPAPGNSGSQTSQSGRNATGVATPVEGRQKLELTIRGLERTWVRLAVDRAPPIDVMIEPAETVGWEATQEFQLTIGKSDGVAVYLNGEEFLIPKEKNQLVRDLVLNKLTLLRLEN